MLCALAGLAVSSGARAQDEAAPETVYVIEHVVVSVNSASDGSGERVGQIQSGEKVEILERQGDQARVRLGSGNEGWVKSSYLSASPPLREQLKARTDELEKLKQEKSKLEADLQAARKAASAAAARPAAPPEAAPPPAAAAMTAEPPVPDGSPAESSAHETESDAVRTSAPPLFSSEGVMPQRPSWMFSLIATAAALAIGFVLGWRMLDRRIRAKYGGLRIY